MIDRLFTRATRTKSTSDRMSSSDTMKRTDLSAIKVTKTMVRVIQAKDITEVAKTVEAASTNGTRTIEKTRIINLL
jgi:hypothetical protein